MRKIMFLVVMGMLLYSCSDKHKCITMIKQYLSQNIDDFSTYNSIEFSNVLPDSSTFLNDSIFKCIEYKQDYFDFQLKNQNNMNTEGLDSYVIDTSNVDFNDSLIYYMNKSREFVDNYHPIQIGWVVKHKYKTDDKIHTGIFHFDINLTKITSANIK